MLHALLHIEQTKHPITSDMKEQMLGMCELAYKVDPHLVFKIAPPALENGPTDERLSTHKRTDCNINRWINSKRQLPI